MNQSKRNRILESLGEIRASISDIEDALHQKTDFEEAVDAIDDHSVAKVVNAQERSRDKSSIIDMSFNGGLSNQASVSDELSKRGYYVSSVAADPTAGPEETDIRYFVNERGD